MSVEVAAVATVPWSGEQLVASILMVDDNPANLMALRAILSPLGHRLVEAQSGPEALKHLLFSEFAAILMDVQMPGMDGIETAALVKQRERTRHIPIIFLTALNKEPSWIFKGYQHGAVDYLLKPFEPEILRAKVSVFVELYLKSEQIKRQEALLRERERETIERKSEQRFRTLIDSMPQCVWAARADGAIYYFNRVWQEYAGRSAAESSELGWLEVVHPDERLAFYQTWTDAVRVRRTCDMQVRLRRFSDGAYRWHLVRALPEKDEQGGVVGWIATATDIDDQKRSEAARAELLLREQEARREAEAANRTKDEFLATVSHELRTPLNAILGWSRMLQAGSLDAERVARALETIERNARVLAELVEDILDVSRIITGKLRLEFQPVILGAVVQAAVDAVRPAAEAKGITLDVDTVPLPDQVSGDPARLQQVVWNLLSNAIKFTPRGGRVGVAMRGLGDGSVELTVSDTGCGIAPEFLPYVFDRFRQADSSSTRMHGGLGLGLAIVRHLLELHGGTVSVSSDGDGRGTTFTVRLPLRPVQLAAEAGEGPAPPPRRLRAPAFAPPQLSGLKVLVVDDEADARELLRAVLGQFGAEVTAAGSAEEALGVVAQWQPDVLVSDIGMPREDGYSLIRKVRALGADKGGAVPAAALTGFARREDGQRALAAGFQTHVAKPVDPSQLVALVAALAGERALP